MNRVVKLSAVRRKALRVLKKRDTFLLASVGVCTLYVTTSHLYSGYHRYLSKHIIARSDPLLFFWACATRLIVASALVESVVYGLKRSYRPKVTFTGGMVYSNFLLTELYIAALCVDFAINR